MSEAARRGPLYAAALLWLALSAFALAVATTQPWLGLEFEASGARVRALGPHADGAEVTAIRQATGAWFAFGAADLNAEPSYLARYRDLDAFFARQSVLAAAMRAPQVVLQRAQGPDLVVVPSPSRPLATLPAHLFVQLAFAAVALLVSALALSRRPEDLSGRYFFATAIGYAIDVTAHGIYSSRELALPGALFHALVSANHVGATVLVSTCGAAMLLFFPRRLGVPWIGPVAVALSAAWATAAELRCFDSLNVGFRLGIFLPFLGTVVLAFLQWRASRVRAVDRAMLNWMLVPYYLGTTLYVVLLLIPASGGMGPQASQTWGWFCVLIVYIGLGLGVTRFRLFYLNPANLELWGAAGLAVVVMYFLLERVARLDATAAMWAALAGTGFLYFPLRDALWRRQSAQYADFEQVLPKVLARTVSARSPEEIGEHWKALLRELYRPRTLEHLPGAVAVPCMQDDGERMVISALSGQGSVAIVAPYGGRALFKPADLRFCEVMGQLFTRLVEYWKAHREGERGERVRLAGQLDAALVSRLRELEPRVANADVSRHLNAARFELEMLTASLRQRDEVTDLASWRSEIEARCAAGGMACRWSSEGSMPALDAVRGRHLRAILREAVNNAVRHSGGSEVAVEVVASATRLRLGVRDDGVGLRPGAAGGRGHTNMRKRALEIGAELSITAERGEGCCIELTLVIPHMGEDPPADRR